MTTQSGATLLARLGFAARGLVYLLVGWFAIDAAMRGGRPDDNQGAIASLADESYGPVLLAIIAAGLAGYAVWRLAEAAADPERIGQDAKGSLKRVGHAISGIVHVGLAFTAARLAMRPRADAGSGDASARSWTAWLLDQPGGWLLVGIVAAGFLAAAAMQAKKAWDGSFARELGGDVPVPDHVSTAGRVGYGARSLVFLIVAGFFVVAAWQTDASEAGGVEAALGALQSQPGGAWLLGAVGAGLMLFGVYGFVEARYRRIRVRVPG